MNVNDFRKKKGLSIEEFAKVLGYSISSITKFIYGEREPSKSFYKRVKKAFPDTDINIFFEE